MRPDCCSVLQRAEVLVSDIQPYLQTNALELFLPLKEVQDTLQSTQVSNGQHSITIAAGISA